MIQKFMGWKIEDYDGDYPPMASDEPGYVMISPVHGEDVIEIQGIVRNWGTVDFRIPIPVMRAWMQEYEKWKASK